MYHLYNIVSGKHCLNLHINNNNEYTTEMRPTWHWHIYLTVVSSQRLTNTKDFNYDIIIITGYNTFINAKIDLKCSDIVMI